MTNIEISALESAGRDTAVWTDGFDAQARPSTVFRALIPALAILVAAVGLMLALL